MRISPSIFICPSKTVPSEILVIPEPDELYEDTGAGAEWAGCGGGVYEGVGSLLSLLLEKMDMYFDFLQK
jgi:hypothetical protein